MAVKDISNAVAEAAGLTNKQAGLAVNALFDYIQNALVSGSEVGVKGFGKFYIQERAARKGRNPRTNTPLTVAARKIVKFKVGRELKSAVR